MSDQETTNEESTEETPITPEEIKETEAAPAADPDAKSEDVPEAEESEPLPEEEDLSTLKGEEVAKTELNRHLRPGMVVRVHEIIADVTPSGEERRRVQVFE